MTRMSETLCFLNSLARSLVCLTVTAMCEYTHTRGPCRATESTWPKGETIEVVIESRQPLVVAKLWYVPPPQQPQNTHNTAEIKTITCILILNRKFRHQKCCVKVLHYHTPTLCSKDIGYEPEN